MPKMNDGLSWSDIPLDASDPSDRALNILFLAQQLGQEKFSSFLIYDFRTDTTDDEYDERTKLKALFTERQFLSDYKRAVKERDLSEREDGKILVMAGDDPSAWDSLVALLYQLGETNIWEEGWEHACLTYGRQPAALLPSYRMYEVLVNSYFKYPNTFLDHHFRSLPGYRYWRGPEEEPAEFRFDAAAREAALRENDRIVEKFLQGIGFPYGNSYAEYLRFLDTTKPGITFRTDDGWVSVGLRTLREMKVPLPTAKRFDVTQSFSQTHTYVVGRSGSGKSELLKSLYTNTLRHTNRVVLDPHGDLANELATDGLTVLAAPASSRFVINPFYGAGKNEADVDLVADEIVQLVCDLVEDAGLSRHMKLIAHPVARTLLRLPYADFRMFTDCFDPDSGKDRLGSISEYVSESDRDLWNALLGDEYDSTRKGVYARLRSILNSRVVTETLCGKDDFGTVMKAFGDESGGEAFAFSVPVTEMGEEASTTLGKFFVTTMQIWARRRGKKRKENRTPVIFMIDEFHNFLGTAVAKTLDQYGRKFGLFMVLAHQHVGQLGDRGLKGAVLANTGNKIAGSSDKPTRQAVAYEMDLDPSDLEGLGSGWWYGKFGANEEPFRFYAKQAGQGWSSPNYAPSSNGDRVENGWMLAGVDSKETTDVSGSDGGTPVPRSGRKNAPAKAGTAKASARKPAAKASKKPAFDL